MADTNFDEQWIQLEKDIDDFRGRSGPGVRKLVIGRYITDLRRAHNSDQMPDDFLPKGYLSNVEAEASASTTTKEGRSRSRSPSGSRRWRPRSLRGSPMHAGCAARPSA